MSQFKLFAVVIVACLCIALGANVKSREYYEQRFYDWLSKYEVQVPTGEHFVKMLQNFADNDDIIESTNAKKLSYALGHNQFSHLSLDEFRAHVRLGLTKPEYVADSIHPAPAADVKSATSIDWVSSGAVTGVKDQGQCGSCWSFSTTGALEGAYYNKYKSLVSFSEQNLVDCDKLTNGGKDHGCNGGLMDNAFDWVKKNGGLCTEADYPYTSGDTKDAGDCSTKCTKNSKVAPASYTDVTPNSDAAMMDALNKQPVSVAIEADQSAFQLYKSGVFTATCGTDLDHGVLTVGYGTYIDGTDYYKVKNSWGTSWGMDGYILLQRGVSQKEGQCGILSLPSYPTLV